MPLRHSKKQKTKNTNRPELAEECYTKLQEAKDNEEF
jgi:hypothetical protein